MTKVFYKDIFLTPLDAIVNPCNCMGIAGAGLAKEFRKRFSKNFTAYRQACHDATLRVGKVFIYQTDLLANYHIQPKYIINFPTKHHWNNPSTMEMIELGMDDMVKQILDLNANPKVAESWRIKSLGIPALGCGLGGLNWNDVSPLIEEKIQPLLSAIDVKVFGPTERADFEDR